MMDWKPEEDRQLMKMHRNHSIAKIAKALNRTYEQVRYRLNYLIKIEETGFDIGNILKEFPDLLPSQRQQAIDIAQYEPGSAWRYCDAIRRYKTKYQEWNPERIRRRRNHDRII